MNGMRFSLDILWLRDGRVVDGVTLEPPRQKPDGTMTDPAIYESSEPANQILEVQAGFARAQGIGIGTVLQLPPY